MNHSVLVGYSLSTLVPRYYWHAIMYVDVTGAACHVGLNLSMSWCRTLL